MKPIRPLVENRAASDGREQDSLRLAVFEHHEVVCGEVGHEAARRVPHADVKGDEIDAALNVCGRSLASLGANRAASSNAAETKAHRCSGLTLMLHPEPTSLYRWVGRGPMPATPPLGGA